MGYVANNIEDLRDSDAMMCFRLMADDEEDEQFAAEPRMLHVFYTKGWTIPSCDH